MRALPAADFPVLRSFGEDVPEFTQGQAFEYGLDLILGTIRNPR